MEGVTLFIPLCLPLLGMTCFIKRQRPRLAGLRAYGRALSFAALKERNDEMDEKVELMRAMREEGKTYQQIADELGYKSHTTVMTALRKLS